MVRHELPAPGIEIAPDALTEHAAFVAKRKLRQGNAAERMFFRMPPLPGGGGGPIKRKPSGDGGQILKYLVTIVIIAGGSAASVLAAPTVGVAVAGVLVSAVAGIVFEVAVDVIISRGKR